MVNPDDVTKFDRTIYELQEYLLFCIVVAGKRAVIQAKKLDNWLKEFSKSNENPLDTIIRLEKEKLLLKSIQKHKLGQYARLSICFLKLATAKIDLKTCTPQDLEKIHGIGPKTSRFFILHSRPNQNLACLDTHILAWLREEGYDAPKSTPSGEKYAELERIFIDECKERNISPAEFDLKIWVQKRKKITYN